MSPAEIFVCIGACPSGSHSWSFNVQIYQANQIPAFSPCPSLSSSPSPNVWRLKPSQSPPPSGAEEDPPFWCRPRGPPRPRKTAFAHATRCAKKWGNERRPGDGACQVLSFCQVPTEVERPELDYPHFRYYKVLFTVTGYLSW